MQLRESGGDDGVGGRHHEVAQVEVLVSGLAPARRDVVHVQVQRARRRGVEREAADAALLECLAQRHLLSRRLPGVAVAARLQPAVELAVVEQEHARAVGGDGDRAARQVALEDPAVEGVLVAQDEGEDLVAVMGFRLVGRGVAAQRVSEGLVGVGGGHGSGILVDLLDFDRTMAAPNHEPPGARAARALPFLVALSGAAALVYQSLWMRSFGLIFGGTTSTVAMVLAVFMGGLALGSALCARRPAVDPLRAYARVELAIGVTALVTLPLLRALPWAYGVLVARSGLTGAAESLGIAILAALVLLPPTVLLGATVPLAVEFLARAGSDVHAGFGRLYLSNTLGGALGVALAPFVLVPALGVRGTLVAAAAASLFVGGVARRWSRDMGSLPPPGERVASGAARTAKSPPALGPALAFSSGAATFGVEVLWTRSYALVIGSSGLRLQPDAAGSAARHRPRLRRLRRACASGSSGRRGPWACSSSAPASPCSPASGRSAFCRSATSPRSRCCPSLSRPTSSPASRCASGRCCR